MPALSQVNQVGKKLDIADFIAVADMRNTPFSTMIPKGKPEIVSLFSVPADAYDQAKTTPGVDGQDVTQFEDAGKFRGLIYSRDQLFERTAMVTTKAEASANRGGIGGGIKSEMARAKAKKAKEYKKDQETVYLSDQDSQPDDGKNGGKTRGVGFWLSGNAPTDAPADIPAQFRTPAAQIYSDVISNFTEDALRTLLQKRWEQVGMPEGVLTAITGSEVKNKVTDFSRYAQDRDTQTSVRFYQTTDLARISATVDVYEGDYGTVEWHLANFLPDMYRAYILDWGFWEQRELINPNWKDLENKGGGPRALLQGVMGIICSNPLGQIMIKSRNG